MSESVNQTNVTWRKQLPLLLVVSGFLPLLFWHVGQLLEKPHYQFLFLMPLTIWMLVAAADDKKTSQLISKRDILLGLAALVVSMGGLSVAAWFWSPWIAAVSFQLGWGAALVANTGWRNAKRWLPLWTFSWIIVPLPFGMDEDLIIRLRGITTRISSSVLDQIGVLHNSYANVIELPGKPLFIADACSGIHSLYVLMAAALFICAWGHRGIFHSLMLLVSTFAIVLIENVARIVSVAVAWGRGWDWSEGSSHEMLGVVLFCLSLLTILSTDQLLMFFFPPNAPSLMERIRKLREDKDGKQKYYAGENSGKTPTPAGASLLTIARQVTFVFPLLLLVQFFTMPSAVPHVMAILDETYDLPQLGESALPETLNGFTREKYETIARVPGDPFGQGSQQWYYRKDDFLCMISVDYPYPGPHDLTVCYHNIGWKIGEHEVLPAERLAQLSGNADGPVGISEMSRPLFGNAMLLFNHTSLAGETQVLFKDLAKGDAADAAARRWTALLTDKKDDKNASSEPQTFLQTQLLIRSPEELPQTSKDELTALFLDAKRLLTDQINQKTGLSK